MLPDSPAAEELRRAHTVLIEYPVVQRSRHREEYAIVSRHFDELARWHKDQTGWLIYRDDQDGVIRLRRRPAAVPVGLWEPWNSDATFDSPRDYACLVYVLWYARSPEMIARGEVRQARLSDMRERIAQRSQALGDGVEPFDFGRRKRDYYSLRRALAALEDLGALRVVDEEDQPDGQVEALIEFTDVATALVAELSLRAVDAARVQLPAGHGLSATALDQVPEPKRRAWRALLVGPALLRCDDEPAYHAVRSNLRLFEREIARHFDTVLEFTPHYARLVRPSGASYGRTPPPLSDQHRGASHATLLLCSELRERVASGDLPKPDDYGCLRLPEHRVAEIFAAVRDRHRQSWGVGLADRDTAWILAEKVLPLARRAGLLRGPDSSGEILVLPTTACYQVEYAEADAPRQFRPDKRRTRRSTAAQPNLGL